MIENLILMGNKERFNIHKKSCYEFQFIVCFSYYAMRILLVKLYH